MGVFKMQSNEFGKPILYKKIQLPAAILTNATIENQQLQFGGDVRIGDLSGDGQVDFLVYRSIDKGMKPCFISAFTIDGKILWQVGQGGEQPARPGPMAIHDIDGDTAAEVICFFIDPHRKATPDSMENVVIQIKDGSTGEVKNQAAPAEFRKCCGDGPNWVHQRILIANFRGTETPRDILVKLGDKVIAFDENIEILWTYRIKWNEYGKCSAYIPSVGDIDGDGRDEVNGGYYLLDHDGKPKWEKQLGEHMDSVAITEWDDGRIRAICSGFGHVVDEHGNIILRLGKEIVPHGQEVRCADFSPESCGPEMITRYNGHEPDVILVSNKGEILKRFQINDSPNNTGMEAIFWHGHDAPALLYNGGMLWRGMGQLFAALPSLPEPVGPARMGWYHCIPANVCGDDREEIVLYNPWDKFIYIYTPSPLDEEAFKTYQPGQRQYNARLMD
jgi:hypothetical protein